MIGGPRGRVAFLCFTTLVFVLPVAEPAGAAVTVVGQVARPTAIRDYAGIQVFSAFEAGSYRLAIRRQERVELLPVAPSPAPFAADIGPDAEGRPQLIYQRCKDARSRGCDLFVLPLAGGGSEQPVRGANSSASEIAPTLWKGRIAFARVSKTRTSAAVFTRTLAAPRSRPSRRLPAIPRTRASVGAVAELELHGDRLAQIVRLSQGRATEVRLVNLSRRRTRRVAHAGVGEAGQYFSGIAFASGYLAWVFGGAIGPNAGIYRERLATGRLAQAKFPVVGLVNGLALFAADGAYLVDWAPDSGDGCGGEEDPPVVRPCQLIRAEPLGFRPFADKLGRAGPGPNSRRGGV